MKLKISALLFLFFIVSNAFAQSFTLVNEQAQASIFISVEEPDYVRFAVEDLVSDVEKITKKKLLITNQIKDCKGNCVIIGSQNIAASKKVIQKIMPSLANFLTGKWEAYMIQSIQNQLIISGSDERGTMFGIYHFIESYLGIDPMYFWSDLPAKLQNKLVWDKIDLRQDSPTFKFRGWFINDEDLLTEWYENKGRRNIDYPFYGQVVSPKVMAKICETALRLRFNLIIPASFLDIRNRAEAALVEEAAKRGFFISMHHIEPMGVNAFTFFNYWKEKDKNPLFSFFSNKAELEEVWKVYANEWGKYPNVIWQIGLRGIADRPMWTADPNTPQTDTDRGKLISEAMQWQVDLIKQINKKNKPLITTTLWSEGSILHQAGHLKLPKDIITIFADNSPGWRMQKDFREILRERNKEYGIYYHHQLWDSGPHLVQAIPPSQTHQVFQEVVNKGDTTYAILNVGNLREFQLGISATADLLYNFRTFSPQNFMQSWAEKRFGKNTLVLKTYQQYFEGFVLEEKRQVPLLLDGQIRGNCYHYLSEIRFQLTDSIGYAKKQQEKKTINEDAFQASLSDMHPQAKDLSTLFQSVVLQKASHLKSQFLVYQALKEINPNASFLLKSNLLSQIQIMLGLETCLEEIIMAKLATEIGQKQTVMKHLQKALSAVAQIQEAKALSTTGEKWKYWYRGDKKLNVSNLEKSILETIKLME